MVAALGLRDTPSLLKALPEAATVKLRIGQRHLHAINQDGLERAYLIAPPQHALDLRLWLSRLQNEFSEADLALASSIRRDNADLTLEYLSDCRQALRAAGTEPVEWNEALAQWIADGVASLLIRNRRWLLTFSHEGEPLLSAVPGDAGVFTPDKLLGWIQDFDGASPDLLRQILCAVSERLCSHH